MHDATAPCAAAELDVAKYRKECDARKATPDADIMERLAAEAYKRRAALDAASGTLAAALAELRERREKELAEIEDEARALEARKEEKNAKANIARAGAGRGRGERWVLGRLLVRRLVRREGKRAPKSLLLRRRKGETRGRRAHGPERSSGEPRRGEARFGGRGAKYRHRSMEEKMSRGNVGPRRPPFKFTPLDL